MKPPTPKSDALRAMREGKIIGHARTAPLTKSDLDHQAKQAADKIAAKRAAKQRPSAKPRGRGR